MQAIASQTSQKLSAEIVNLTNVGILETVLDSCQASELNAVVYGFHYHCDLVGSNIDKMKLLRNQLPSVGWAVFDSILDYLDYVTAIGDVEAIEYYTVMPQQMLDLKFNF